MATTWCPDTSADPAIVVVGQAHDKFLLQGDQTVQKALENLDALNGLPLDSVNVDVPFNFDQSLAAFVRPTRPVFDDAQLEFRDPGIVLGPAPAYIPSPIVTDPAPAIDALPPTITPQQRPTAPNIQAPTPPPPNAPVVLPTQPDYTLPPVPTFESLNLPAAPVVNIPEFAAQAPIFVPPPFNQTWSFQPEAYEHTLTNELVRAMQPMIRGSEALPQIIERAIFARGAARIDKEADRLVDQAFADTANRGFSLPQGETLFQTSQIRQQQLNSLGDLSREVLIKQYEESAANQRFAITQGAALEGTLIQLHVEGQRFMLQAAIEQRDTAIAYLNYRVSVFSMQLQAYQADAAVARDRIQAELAKVEVFRAQIEGERARGEINEQRVRLYIGQLQGIQAMADFYRTQMEGVKVQVDVGAQRIEQYRAQIQAYTAQLEAHATEWKGYIASWEGEGRKAEVFGKLVDAQAKRVDAWAAGQNMVFEKERLSMDQQRLRVDVWGRGLQLLDTTVNKERARLAAVGQAYDAKARIYEASAQVESAATAATDRSFELALARARAETDARFKSLELRIQQTDGIRREWVTVQEAKARIFAQLAASTLSAVNYGASLSSGRSKSTSCSQNFQFQGEIADA